MRFDDLFNDIDKNTADRLSKEYPVLKDEKRERLYAMSKRKYNINEMHENNAAEVSGVEEYRRPKWYKGASIAAAAVLLVAGIGGSMAFISRNGHSPAAEVETVTETATEVTTDSEDTIYLSGDEDVTDANAIAKLLTDNWLACLYDIHGRTLEVDKSSVVTKIITSYGGDEITRDFYRVTDKRYPTWEDLEKRCYEVCDAELGKIVIDNCSCAKEEDIDYATLIYTTADGYYVNTETCDTSDRLYKWLDDDVKGEFDENGNIITTRRHIDLDVDPDHVYETKFTIVNTENGWRISKAEEKNYEQSSEGSQDTNADTIAKPLIDDYMEFMCALHAGDLEVDKSDTITKTMKTEDGQYEYQLEFYRVTDPRYPTWADIEKRCLEILDNELGHKVLEMCSDIDEDTKKHTFVCTTDNGYYIEKGIHDIGVETLKWEGYDLNSEFDENGNIIAAIRHTHQIESQDFTLETTFTIVNTENGWRISDVTEKPVDESESDQ